MNLNIFMIFLKNFLKNKIFIFTTVLLPIFFIGVNISQTSSLDVKVGVFSDISNDDTLLNFENDDIFASFIQSEDELLSLVESRELNVGFVYTNDDYKCIYLEDDITHSFLKYGFLANIYELNATEISRNFLAENSLLVDSEIYSNTLDFYTENHDDFDYIVEYVSKNMLGDTISSKPTFSLQIILIYTLIFSLFSFIDTKSASFKLLSKFISPLNLELSMLAPINVTVFIVSLICLFFSGEFTLHSVVFIMLSNLFFFFFAFLLRKVLKHDLIILSAPFLAVFLILLLNF